MTEQLLAHIPRLHGHNFKIEAQENLLTPQETEFLKEPQESYLKLNLLFFTTPDFVCVLQPLQNSV